MKKKRGRPRKKPVPFKGLMYPSSVELIMHDDGIWEIRIKEKLPWWKRMIIWGNKTRQ